MTLKGHLLVDTCNSEALLAYTPAGGASCAALAEQHRFAASFQEEELSRLAFKTSHKKVNEDLSAPESLAPGACHVKHRAPSWPATNGGCDNDNNNNMTMPETGPVWHRHR